jgi:hypothetical protein
MMEGSENPTASPSSMVGDSSQAKDVRSAARRAAAESSTQTRDGQDGSRVFIEAHGMVKVIRPRRDLNEDRPE